MLNKVKFSGFLQPKNFSNLIESIWTSGTFKRVNIWLGGKGKTNRLCWLPGFSCADDSLDEICWFAGQSCQNASLKAVSGRGAQCMYGFGPMGVRQDWSIHFFKFRKAGQILGWIKFLNNYIRIVTAIKLYVVMLNLSLKNLFDLSSAERGTRCFVNISHWNINLKVTYYLLT